MRCASHGFTDDGLEDRICHNVSHLRYPFFLHIFSSYACRPLYMHL